MIEWYKSDKLSIFFSDTPHVCVRYVLPSSTPDEVKSIKKYPFICKTNLTVALFDHVKNKSYKFTIPKGYCYDAMTIPRFAWSLIGVSKEDNRGLIAALLHDYLTTNRELIDNDRALSTNVFNALLEVGGMNKFKRFIMKNAVACYQTLFCDWGLEYNK